MNSKLVTFTSYSNCFQYSVVFVYSSTAFQKILLCSVFSWSTNFPIILRVFLLFNCDSFLIPNSISVASFVPYIGDRKMALIARLFEILYLSCMAFSLFSGVFMSPYYTYAYIAPTIKFLLMFGVIPPPLSMNGTIWALVFSALVSCLFKCSLCCKSCSIIFPKYLYLFVLSISTPSYVILPA